MKKLLTILLSVTAIFSSFEGNYGGIEGRYEYHTYSSSLQLDKNISINSKSKPHSKLTPGAFIGKNYVFGKNYLGCELKLIGPTSQRKTFAYEDEDVSVSFKRGIGTFLSAKLGTLITDAQSAYLKPSLFMAKYTSKNSFKTSKRRIYLAPVIGTERLINDKTIARLEYEYLPTTVVRYTKDSVTHNHGENAHVVSAGIAYKF
jgi:opacity protein-like surface antigen